MREGPAEEVDEFSQEEFHGDDSRRSAVFRPWGLAPTGQSLIEPRDEFLQPQDFRDGVAHAFSDGGVEFVVTGGTVRREHFPQRTEFGAVGRLHFAQLVMH